MAVADPLLVAEELEKEYRTGPRSSRPAGVNLTLGPARWSPSSGASGIGKTTLLYWLDIQKARFAHRPNAARRRWLGTTCAGS